ncbi:helix-turn-helix domain-containing protein [Lysinibacillus sp. FSL R7-0073]|uniref:helix-turn-helix domain-containing protein n=1 Tax=Lysinibacillus sp. FSL R7-0073 TaxID=2921669 RepID=UPI0030F6A20B
MEKLLTVKEVSELFGVTQTTVRRWVMEDTIPSYLIGGARRFSYYEVINHVKKGAKKV